MAAQISLLEYLQHAPPIIPTNPPQDPRHNTTNDSYGAGDIRSVTPWQEFNVNTILQNHQNLLVQALLAPDPFPASPPPRMNSEMHLRLRTGEYLVPRVRRALRAAFTHLTNMNQLNGRTPVSFDAGESAATIDTYKPDIAYYDILFAANDGPNRAPGDLKPGWKWSSSLRTGTISDEREYRQGLSQVNWYMKQHRARYGVLLTNEELVAIRRLDYNGNLQVSNPVPWELRGTTERPQLTVLLELWYLGMLASGNQGPDPWDL